MVSPAPERFSPDLLSRQPQRLSADFPLAKCTRLADFLAESDAADQVSEDRGASLKAEFECTRQGRLLLIKGELETVYRLECQRCLQPFDHNVVSSFEFVMVEDQAQAEELADEFDPVILDDEGMISLVQLFEDELILLVPSVPKHESPEDCEFSVDVTIDETPDTQKSSGVQRAESAFAELKNLRFDD